VCLFILEIPEFYVSKSDTGFDFDLLKINSKTTDMSFVDTPRFRERLKYGGI